jgi:hypothetical protein
VQHTEALLCQLTSYPRTRVCGVESRP